MKEQMLSHILFCSSCSKYCYKKKVFSFRNNCQYCNCDLRNHSPIVEDEVDFSHIMNDLKIPNTLPIDTPSDEDSGCAIEEYSWTPPGLKLEQIKKYMKCLPDDKVPFVHSVGEKYRIQQLLQQLPPHDSEPMYCNSLSKEERFDMLKFTKIRSKEYLGRGKIYFLSDLDNGASCHVCQKNFNTNDTCVFSDRLGESVKFHPQCFSCSDCQHLLVDLIHFTFNGNLYCGRHHAEKFKPRCAACDEIIFSNECTDAEGSTWHPKHFTCTECNTELGDKRYVMKDGPCCCNCYESKFNDVCDTCQCPIKLDESQITHLSVHWHKSQDCFSCYYCKTSLLDDKPYLPKMSHIFCSTECSSLFMKDSGYNSSSTNASTGRPITDMIKRIKLLNINKPQQDDYEECDIFSTISNDMSSNIPSGPPIFNSTEMSCLNDYDNIQTESQAKVKETHLFEYIDNVNSNTDANNNLSFSKLNINPTRLSPPPEIEYSDSSSPQLLIGESIVLKNMLFVRNSSNDDLSPFYGKSVVDIDSPKFKPTIFSNSESIVNVQNNDCTEHYENLKLSNETSLVKPTEPLKSLFENLTLNKNKIKCVRFDKTPECIKVKSKGSKLEYCKYDGLEWNFDNIDSESDDSSDDTDDCCDYNQLKSKNDKSITSAHQLMKMCTSNPNMINHKNNKKKKFKLRSKRINGCTIC